MGPGGPTIESFFWMIIFWGDVSIRNQQKMVNSWFGIVGVRVPLSNNPFQKGMLQESKLPGPKPPINY